MQGKLCVTLVSVFDFITCPIIYLRFLTMPAFFPSQAHHDQVWHQQHPWASGAQSEPSDGLWQSGVSSGLLSYTQRPSQGGHQPNKAHLFRTLSYTDLISSLKHSGVVHTVTFGISLPENAHSTHFLYVCLKDKGTDLYDEEKLEVDACLCMQDDVFLLLGLALG